MNISTRFLIFAGIVLSVSTILFVFGSRKSSETRAQQVASYSNIYNIDPCANSGVTKSSVVINLTSATTTQLIAATTGKQIFACGFAVTMAGVAQSIQFEYGTGTNCNSGTTTLTGAMANGTLSVIVISYGGAFETIFQTPVSQQLCSVTTGLTVGIQGVLTYVIQ